jgi:hypothetical protein
VCLELLQLVLLRELSSEAAAHHSTPVPKGTKNKNMLVKLEISVEKTQSSSQKLHGSSNTKSLQVQHTKYIYSYLYMELHKTTSHDTTLSATGHEQICTYPSPPLLGLLLLVSSSSSQTHNSHSSKN